MCAERGVLLIMSMANVDVLRSQVQSTLEVHVGVAVATSGRPPPPPPPFFADIIWGQALKGVQSPTGTLQSTPFQNPWGEI